MYSLNISCVPSFFMEATGSFLHLLLYSFYSLLLNSFLNHLSFNSLIL